MVPSYIGWTIGTALWGLVVPLGFTLLGVPTLLGALVTTAWVGLRAPKHRILGTVICFSVGVIAGLTSLPLLFS